MANTRTLTAANAIIMLGVIGLYDTPRRLQGFSADDVSDLDALAVGEGSMGVDGRLSAGFVFNPINQNITLQADSLSNDFFENWQQAERTQREKYVAFGTILIRSTGKRYTMTRGFLMSSSLMPAIRKTLQPRRYSMTWENVSSGPA
jgi:hypothetical protein